MAEGCPAIAYDVDVFRCLALDEQIEEGRDQLSLGQIAGGAKDDNRGRDASIHKVPRVIVSQNLKPGIGDVTTEHSNCFLSTPGTNFLYGDKLYVGFLRF